MPDARQRADAGDGADQTGVPEEHEGPRNDEADDQNQSQNAEHGDEGGYELFHIFDVSDVVVVGFGELATGRVLSNGLPAAASA